MNNYLEKKVVNQLSRIQFISKKLISSQYKGFHKSLEKGKNMEFKEHREYTYGDELRDIDWKIYGKTERYYVKDFEKDVSANILVILDSSSSMTENFANAEPKIEYAKYIASSLSYIFLKQRDQVAVATFDNNFEILINPTNSISALKTLNQKLNHIKNEKKVITNFSLLKYAENIYKNLPTIIFLISDMINDEKEIMKGLSYLDKKNNQNFIYHLIHNLEHKFNLNGYIDITEPETGKVISAKASDLKMRFTKLYDDYINNLRLSMNKHRFDYNKFLLSKHYSTNLMEFFKKHKIN